MISWYDKPIAISPYGKWFWDKPNHDMSNLVLSPPLSPKTLEGAIDALFENHRLSDEVPE